MESTIVKHLQPEFDPVAVIWSDAIPENAMQFKPGRFGCILYLFASAARRGRTAGGSRRSIICPGGRAALGLGFDLDASDEMLERYAVIFSKGLQSAGNKEAYRKQIEAAPKSWRSLFEYGERRHCNAELAKDWILKGLPRYDIPHEYVLFKPLNQTDPGENIRAVIFPVGPDELGGLSTLAGSVVPGTDPIQVPQGADCMRTAAFAYAQADQEPPRAILGMLDVDGREVMRKHFHRDTMTLTLPTSLFKDMEMEAGDSIFQTPAWKSLMGA